MRGAKMLATGGIMANEVFVTCIQPLQPGDEKYARVLRRADERQGPEDPVAQILRAERAQSVFDNPLSSRFDENDAVLYFDDVKVPWERVFVVDRRGDVPEAVPCDAGARLPELPGQIRLSVKLRFLIGIARRIAEVNGIIGFPQVRETLGQLAAEAAMVDAFVAAMEAKGSAARPVLRARPAHALRRADADAAALSEDHRRRCANWPAAA